MGSLQRNINLILVLVIPTLSFIFALITIDDYGVNWDEPYHYRRGQAFLHYFLTGKKTYEGMPKYPPLKGTTDTPGFRNSDQLFKAVQENPSLSDSSYRRSYYQNDAWNGEFFIDMESPAGHPPLNGILASLFNKIFYQKLGIVGDIESYHLFIITTVGLASFFIAIFIWKEFGKIESIFTSLAFSTYPLLLCEQHFNIKDPVVASFYAMALITAYLGVKKKKLPWFFTSIIFFALGISTKFNILFLIPVFGFWFLLSKQKLTKQILLALTLSLPIVLTIFIFSFPTLWKDIPSGIIQIVNFYLKEGYANPQVSNPIVWIIYTTPPMVLFLTLVGMLNIRNLIKKNSFALLVLLWLLISFARVSLFGASNYGGARLIMEYIPALAIFTGISAGHLINRQRGKYWGICLFIFLAGFIPTIIKLKQIHPNENVYFNFFIGGLSGAKNKNLDSWGNSYGNAYYPLVVWMNNNSENGSRLTLPINSTVNIPRYKLRSDIALSNSYWAGPKHDGEYVSELTHDYEPKSWYSLKYLENVLNPIYEVKVDGVAIAKLWKNDLDFVRDEFRQTQTLKTEIISNKNTLILTLPETRKLMQVSITVPTENCTLVKTGYAATSIDNITWIREPEDIARDQLKQAKLREISRTFDFYFVAKEAKSIIFETENSDTCLLKATSAVATVLQDW